MGGEGTNYVMSSAMVMFYFEKKGMSLNCDIFFKKNKYVVVKLVYLSAMYRFDQGIVTRLNIADVVLKEYKKDESSVSEICSEAMFKFWRENGCQLIRYGFNELCK